MFDVIVVGAGAAGLAAGCKLARAGLNVAVIEARARPGGRMWSVPGPAPMTTGATYELGAEFIHGSQNAVTDLCQEAGLRTFASQERHWRFTGKGLMPDETLWKNLEASLGRVDFHKPDLSFDRLLRKQTWKKSDAQRLRMYVEGFDAADTRRISSQALAHAQKEGQDKSLRLKGGYGRLAEWLRVAAENAGAQFCFSTVAQSIAWRRGAIEVSAETLQKRTIFPAHRAIITLPLGLLKRRSVRFVPDLKNKQTALRGLEMGHVIKLSLCFSSRFWNRKIDFEDFGFIHGPGLSFPTWWSRKRAPLLTAWIGGPRAEAMRSNDLLTLALRDLRKIFGVSLPNLRRQLRDWRYHDWRNDRFSGGAYTYTTAGHLNAPGMLCEPIEDTLYFAGEATVSGAAQGTVHGALDSGTRAAEQVLERAMSHQR